MTNARYYELVREYWGQCDTGYRWFRNIDMHHKNPGAGEVSQSAERQYKIPVWKWQNDNWTVHKDDEKNFSVACPGSIKLR